MDFDVARCAGASRNLKMKPTYYPYHAHVADNVLKRICAEHTGILQSLMVSPARSVGDLGIRSISGQMPHYHRVVIDPALDIRYHLAGYGQYYEEALIRYVGEGIERYSSIAWPTASASRVRYATYDEMSAAAKVIPFDYLRILSEADCSKLHGSKHRVYRQLARTDIVGWVECPSLVEPSNSIWVPAQVISVGYKINADAREVAFLPSFSTGTAAHTSFEAAMLNAILEVLQIDALMLHWYCRGKAVRLTIDSAILAEMLVRYADYDVVVCELPSAVGTDIHVFGTALVARRDERPLIVFGSQADFDPVAGVYRSLMEATAITFLATYGPVFSPQEYLSQSNHGFLDLDTNVGWYADPAEAETKRNLIYSMLEGRRALSSLRDLASGNQRADLLRLISAVSRISSNAAFLDVTPPEVRNLGWYVVRVIVPELVTMCLPGIPYSLHPRFRAFGGIKNEYPHPLP